MAWAAAIATDFIFAGAAATAFFAVATFPFGLACGFGAGFGAGLRAGFGADFGCFGACFGAGFFALLTAAFAEYFFAATFGDALGLAFFAARFFGAAPERADLGFAFGAGLDGFLILVVFAALPFFRGLEAFACAFFGAGLEGFFGATAFFGAGRFAGAFAGLTALFLLDFEPDFLFFPAAIDSLRTKFIGKKRLEKDGAIYQLKYEERRGKFNSEAGLRLIHHSRKSGYMELVSC